VQNVVAKELVYEFTRHREPLAQVQPGETLTVEAEDALSGQIRQPGDRRDKEKVPFSNPVTGPIAVMGAKPGDTLCIKIESILPRDGQCATYTGNVKQMGEWLGTEVPHGAHVCPIRDGLVYWSDELTIPYEPMLGCVGVAPSWGVPTTIPAGPHGGNMDIVETRPGSTVYLPVFVDDAFLYLGDAHAAMGHGELSATGLEMASVSTITVDLIRHHQIDIPRIETPTEIMTIVSGNPMERSIAESYAKLILWMESDYGWDRWKAYDLLTHVGQISIGYYGIGTVAAKVSKDYLQVKNTGSE
jgi:amidase